MSCRVKFFFSFYRQPSYRVVERDLLNAMEVESIQLNAQCSRMSEEDMDCHSQYLTPSLNGIAPASPKLAEKQVRFHQVEIIELPLLLGDNPSVSAGAPLTVDWVPQGRFDLTVDRYETLHRRRRYSKHDMILSEYDRHELLLRQGYSEQEIRQASEQIASEKKIRTIDRQRPEAEEMLTRQRMRTEDRSKQRRIRSSVRPIKKLQPGDRSPIRGPRVRSPVREICSPICATFRARGGRRTKEINLDILQTGIDISI